MYAIRSYYEPRELFFQEDSFWMRHHDRKAPIFVGETGQSVCRTVWVGWITVSWFAVVVNEPEAGEGMGSIVGGTKCCPAFAVGNYDRQPDALHIP